MIYAPARGWTGRYKRAKWFLDITIIIIIIRLSLVNLFSIYNVREISRRNSNFVRTDYQNMCSMLMKSSMFPCMFICLFFRCTLITKIREIGYLARNWNQYESKYNRFYKNTMNIPRNILKIHIIVITITRKCTNRGSTNNSEIWKDRRTVQILTSQNSKHRNG